MKCFIKSQKYQNINKKKIKKHLTPPKKDNVALIPKSTSRCHTHIHAVHSDDINMANIQH